MAYLILTASQMLTLICRGTLDRGGGKLLRLSGAIASINVQIDACCHRCTATRTLNT